VSLGPAKYCLLVAACGFASAGHAGTVDSVRLAAGPDATRVVLDLSGPAEHRVFSLDNPHRLVIDLPDTAIASGFTVSTARGFVTDVRTGQRPRGEARVVLDLTGKVKPKSFLLEPSGQYGHRLVIDLEGDSGKEFIRRAPQRVLDSGRDIVIAIDAGHGGRDPGASGPRGAREKDIVMQIARRLADVLDDQPGFRPMLVRDNDRFIPLRERTRIARAAEADLFISIHADSYRNAMARGATVYVVSEKGASDEAAARLAERENAADLIGGVSLADKDDVLATVLLDLSQNAAISASVAAGERIIHELGTVTKLRKTEVQQAPFAVLKSVDIPSVLIETAYLSNPDEEAALRRAEHQSDLARALTRGITDYFFDNPPPGSYMAANPGARPRGPMHHSVTRGETLSEIAERYRVSLASLKRFNSLRSDRIRIGQILQIPRT
jgi:N-acetylmuramoyl-L-alanine amidase